MFIKITGSDMSSIYLNTQKIFIFFKPERSVELGNTRIELPGSYIMAMETPEEIMNLIKEEHN